MKIRLNPEIYGDQPADGTDLEWKYTGWDDNDHGHIFRPPHELPIGRDGHRHKYQVEYMLFDSWEDFYQKVDDGWIIIVENEKGFRLVDKHKFV